MALQVLLASIAVSTLLGIVAILGDKLGHFSGHVLLASLVVAGSSLLALAWLAAWEVPAARVVSRAGVAISAIGTVLWIGGIVEEPRGDLFWQLAGSLALLAIAAAHACTLWLARLSPRAAIVRTAALACSVLLVVMLLAALWDNLKSDAGEELVAVLAIAEAGLTVAVAAIAAVSRGAPGPAGSPEVCFCVRCGKSLWVPAGEVRCRHCNEAFFVELRRIDDLPDAILKR
jgi:hypothetical protein